ncbi:MAG: hypothetical protein GXO80_10255 [Chlorobi bacterium]|nr:hypothetical protein [Chlorobiota bacterium]
MKKIITINELFSYMGQIITFYFVNKEDITGILLSESVGENPNFFVVPTSQYKEYTTHIDNKEFEEANKMRIYFQVDTIKEFDILQ